MSKLSGLVNVLLMVLRLVRWWWWWCCLFLPLAIIVPPVIVPPVAIVVPPLTVVVACCLAAPCCCHATHVRLVKVLLFSVKLYCGVRVALPATTPQHSSVAFLAGKKTSPFFSEETSHA